MVECGGAKDVSLVDVVVAAVLVVLSVDFLVVRNRLRNCFSPLRAG